MNSQMCSTPAVEVFYNSLYISAGSLASQGFSWSAEEA